MAAPKRSKIQREADLERISALYLQGWRQVDIATEIGVAQSQIAYDLKVIQRRWQKQTAINLDEAKNRELARVDILEREYWQAWERSCQNAETETIEQIGQALPSKQAGEQAQIAPQRIKKNKRIEGQSGNPAFLAGVERCIDMRCKILGIYAPTKNENKNDGDVTLRVLYGTDGSATPTP